MASVWEKGTQKSKDTGAKNEGRKIETESLREKGDIKEKYTERGKGYRVKRQAILIQG